MLSLVRRFIAFGFLFLGLAAGIGGAVWGIGALPVWYATTGGVITDMEELHLPVPLIPGDLSRSGVRIRLGGDDKPYVYRAALGFSAADVAAALKVDDAVVITYRQSGDAVCGAIHLGDAATSSLAAVWQAACDLLVGPPRAIVLLTAGGREPVSYLDTAAPDALVFLFLLWVFVRFTRLGFRGLSAADD